MVMRQQSRRLLKQKLAQKEKDAAENAVVLTPEVGPKQVNENGYIDH